MQSSMCVHTLSTCPDNLCRTAFPLWSKISDHTENRLMTRRDQHHQLASYKLICRSFAWSGTIIFAPRTSLGFTVHIHRRTQTHFLFQRYRVFLRAASQFKRFSRIILRLRRLHCAHEALQATHVVRHTVSCHIGMRPYTSWGRIAMRRHLHRHQQSVH
jgi:hypothetical protein